MRSARETRKPAGFAGGLHCFPDCKDNPFRLKRQPLSGVIFPFPSLGFRAMRLRKFLFGFGVLLLIVALAGLIASIFLHRSGSRKLEEASSALDAEDPGWRLPEIESARKAAQPVDDANSAAAVLKLHEQLPTWWNGHRQSEAAYIGNSWNRTPSFWQLVWMLKARKPTLELRESARRELLKPAFLEKPGFYSIQFAEFPFATTLPHAQKARDLAALIEYDAMLAGIEGNPDRGLMSIRALLVVGLSIGDEPFLVSQLVRMACDRMAVQSALQILAWGRPTQHLAELQAELLAEAEHNGLQTGLRGERAMVDATFEGIRSGKIPLDKLGGDTGVGGGFGGAIGFQAYRGMLPGDQAKSLELLSAALKASQLPPHERLAALAAIPFPPGPPDDFRYLLSRLLTPSWVKVTETHLRLRADLLTAAAAIACERYRIANGRWPESLEAIPKSILKEVPTDPYTGQPILYRKLADGIAVYSVGERNQQRLEQRRQMNDPLLDLGQGWKLWNPELRGLKPERAPDPLPAMPIP